MYGMTITDKLSRLRAINLRTLFDTILRENEDYICDLNKDQMYEGGVMNVNTGQKEKYAQSTIKSKHRAPFPKTDFITLKWTGDFHKTLKLQILKDTFFIMSHHGVWNKYIEPQKRFESALGLTKESKAELRDLVRDELIRKIRHELS
jgi:hypothetical protein